MPRCALEAKVVPRPASKDRASCALAKVVIVLVGVPAQV